MVAVGGAGATVSVGCPVGGTVAATVGVSLGTLVAVAVSNGVRVSNGVSVGGGAGVSVGVFAGAAVGVAGVVGCSVVASVGLGVAGGVGDGVTSGADVADGDATAGGVLVGGAGAIVDWTVLVGSGGARVEVGGCGLGVPVGSACASCRLEHNWASEGAILGPLPLLHAQPSTSPSRTL